ncbi:MAG: hypothetical protein GX161_15230 [Firmicutes bacterium]|nr:hypothetical protein [Bacillota bacterium]
MWACTAGASYPRHYRHIDISAHARLLRDRQNVLCVRAVKAEGDRGIDVGLYGV